MNAQVFQKGSPIARDFSKAILTLSENNQLKLLQDKWVGSPSKDCADSDSRKADEVESKRLRIDSFYVLMLISAGVSIVCALIVLIPWYLEKKPIRKNGSTVGNGLPVTQFDQPKPPPTTRS